MRWEDVLRRSDIVGGELETQEDGVVYRGPISAIRLENGNVHIESPWVAKLERGGWKKQETIYPFFVNTEFSPPNEIGDGRVSFNMPMLGIGVIYPKDGSKLDPAKVEGLKLAKTPTLS